MDFLLIYFDIPYCNIYFNNSFHKLIDVQVSIANYKMNDQIIGQDECSFIP